MENQHGDMKPHPVAAVELHHWAMEAHPTAVEAMFGAVEAFFIHYLFSSSTAWIQTPD